MNAAEVYLRRLKAHRWIIAVALVLFAVLFASGQLSFWAATFSAGVVIAAGALAPVRSQKVKSIQLAGANQTPPKADQIYAIINAVPDPVILMDSDGNVSFINHESRRVFTNVTVGARVLLRFRDPDFQAMIRAALQGQSPAPTEYVESGTPGNWFLASVGPVDVGLAESHYLVHFRDFSETKRIDKVRSDFIANASHELRTPLASLTGFIETLAGPARNDESARDNFLKIMQEQAERMSRLIDDLLTLSRFETARGQSNFAPVKIVPIIKHISDALKPMAQHSGVTIEVHVDENLPDKLSVFGNHDELIQLFENLVENAIKYGKEGGSVKIGLTQNATGDSIEVSVEDDGPGIAEEHIPRLVERFYRVDVDSSRIKQGTGLGLSIVKHITQRHKGKLNIKSEVGVGSRFIVTIPTWAGESVEVPKIRVKANS